MMHWVTNTEVKASKSQTHLKRACGGAFCVIVILQILTVLGVNTKQRGGPGSTRSGENTTVAKLLVVLPPIARPARDAARPSWGIEIPTHNGTLGYLSL